MKTQQWSSAVLLSSALLAACATVKKAYDPAPEPHKQLDIMPAANPDQSKNKHADGSIYSSQALSLYADDKALHRGDIVLVRVNQNNTGSKQGNTQTTRDSSISAGIKYLFGLEKPINNLTNYTNIVSTPASGTTPAGKTVGAWDPNNLVESSSSDAFKGNASTNRADTLVATVSTIVTDVLSNGNLVVYGHQTVTVNNEASVLTVQGIVRPSDLADDNSVDASRIANSNIEFTGSGVISDKQHPGFGIRAFDWLWPF